MKGNFQKFNFKMKLKWAVFMSPKLTQMLNFSTKLNTMLLSEHFMDRSKSSRVKCLSHFQQWCWIQNVECLYNRWMWTGESKGLELEFFLIFFFWGGHFYQRWIHFLFYFQGYGIVTKTCISGCIKTYFNCSSRSVLSYSLPQRQWFKSSAIAASSLF